MNDILNTTKCAKNETSHFSLILHGFMNICKGKTDFKIFLILFDCGCTSNFVTDKMISKIKRIGDATRHCKYQARKFTKNEKVEIGLCLPEFSVTNMLTWEYRMGDYTEFWYYMILGRYIPTPLVLVIKISTHIIAGGDIS